MRNIEGSEAKFKMKRMLENEKALGNKISASIIMRHIGNINAWGGCQILIIIAIIYFIYYILFTENALKHDLTFLGRNYIAPQRDT